MRRVGAIVTAVAASVALTGCASTTAGNPAPLNPTSPATTPATTIPTDGLTTTPTDGLTTTPTDGTTAVPTDGPTTTAPTSTGATTTAPTTAAPTTTAPTTAGSTTAAPTTAAPHSDVPAPVTAKFRGVTVTDATNLSEAPGVTSTSATAPTALEYKDLVVGTGKTPTPTSTVTVQYAGVLYKNGKAFDSTWQRGAPTQFPLASVIAGFSRGLAGTTGVPPMKVGGRRILIIPASLGYGAQATGSIPANSPLVFVVDLTTVS